MDRESVLGLGAKAVPDDVKAWADGLVAVHHNPAESHPVS